MHASMRRDVSRALSIYGAGGVGGKGDGFVQLEGIMPSLKGPARIEPLETRILATGIYSRYMGNGRKLDSEALNMLREVHASLNGKPISVRPSEKEENDPTMATSGENTSFMLPNNNPDVEARFGQFLQAVTLAFENYAAKPGSESGEGVAIVANTIHCVIDDTPAGRFGYPMSSGVADSFFHYPVAGKGAEEGFARVAFGHGYATVRDDFPVVPVLTIANPERPSGICSGQRYFYAINMSRNNGKLDGSELGNVSRLSINHANSAILRHFTTKGVVFFDALLTEDRFGYASGLKSIVEQLSRSIGACQIEFTFNVRDGQGVFHIVQLKKMLEPDLSKVTIPEDGKREYISTSHVQGNGAISGIRHAIVINPFTYTKEMHGEMKGELKRLNDRMHRENSRYVLVCPGRVGTTNLDWGISVDFQDISAAGVIVEYGYDITGNPDIPLRMDEMTGGNYGSHFLYQILGGAAADDKIRELRRLGSQGTHFLTNIVTTGAHYLLVAEGDVLEPWFFEPPAGQESSQIYLKEFEHPVTSIADLHGRRCVVK